MSEGAMEPAMSQGASKGPGCQQWARALSSKGPHRSQQCVREPAISQGASSESESQEPAVYQGARQAAISQRPRSQQ